jgi:hypothetical protein
MSFGLVRVRKGLCRTQRGRFVRCRGKVPRGAHARGGVRHCRFGVNKRTSRCLKRRRSR